MPAEPDDAFPDVNAVPYELRFTRLALEDLGCPKGTPAGDLPTVMRAAKWPSIVEEFNSQRQLSPQTTGGTLARCGYPDVAELHGPAGGRAATWYDPESQVVWFLGFDPQHRYKRFEARAAQGELMPSIEDETDLELEIEKRDFDRRIRDDLRKLVSDAVGRPDEAVRGLVGGLLRLEVTVAAIAFAGSVLIDLFISIRLPPLVGGVPSPPGWPAGDLPNRLVSLVFDEARPWDCPQHIPTGAGRDRPVRHDEEFVVLVPNCEPSDFVHRP